MGMHGSEHMVVRHEVVETQGFDDRTDPTDRARVSAKLVLRIDSTDLHVQPPTVTKDASASRGPRDRGSAVPAAPRCSAVIAASILGSPGRSSRRSGPAV